MRTEFAQVLTQRNKRSFVWTNYLIKLQAKDRSNGQIATLGLWDGEDNVNFSIGGTVTLFYGAARVLLMPEFDYELGLDAATYEIGLAQTDEVVNTLIRGYDPRLGECEIWRLEWDTDSQLLGGAVRIFKGFVDGTPISTPELGGSGGVSLQVVTEAKLLSKYGSMMKSHDFQNLRSNDGFRRYSSVTKASVPWGKESFNESPGFIGVARKAAGI